MTGLLRRVYNPQILFSAVDQWTQGKLVMDSGVYAHRPPTQSDLNSEMLEAIYRGLKQDHNDIAARNFVRLVNKLEDLSASVFIVTLERFWASRCKQTDIVVSNKVHNNSVRNKVQAFEQLANALTGKTLGERQKKNLSEGIKSDFIKAHREEIPRHERRSLITA